MEEETGAAEPEGLVQEEEIAEGAVGVEMYKYYMREAGGWWVLVLMLVCIFVMQAVLIGSEWWLGRYVTSTWQSHVPPRASRQANPAL